MYAVIETGGKQYRVEVGTELEVESLDAELGKTIKIERVLLIADGDDASIGRPVVDGAEVSVEIVRQTRGEKLINFKYGPKTRRRVKKGHRQELTVLRVSDIVLNGKSAAKAAAKADADAKTERQRVEEAAKAQAAKDAALAEQLSSSKKTTTPSKSGGSKDAAKAPAEKPATKPTARGKAAAGEKPPAKAAPKAAAKPAKPAAKSADKPAPKPRTSKPRTTKKDE